MTAQRVGGFQLPGFRASGLPGFRASGLPGDFRASGFPGISALLGFRGFPRFWVSGSFRQPAGVGHRPFRPPTTSPVAAGQWHPGPVVERSGGRSRTAHLSPHRSLSDRPPIPPSIRPPPTVGSPPPANKRRPSRAQPHIAPLTDTSPRARSLPSQLIADLRHRVDQPVHVIRSGVTGTPRPYQPAFGDPKPLGHRRRVKVTM
jgi:hypothetical protein